jgi:hypothetical protein
MHPAPETPRRRPVRPTIKAARHEAERVATEAWAWTALYACLSHIVEMTLQGKLLPPAPWSEQEGRPGQ